jgi:hypothetical protein
MELDYEESGDGFLATLTYLQQKVSSVVYAEGINEGIKEGINLGCIGGQTSYSWGMLWGLK